MPKRGDRVAPPPGAAEWDIRFGDASAVLGWQRISSQAPGPTRSAWMTLRSEPKLREICRAREVVCDFIAGDNEYGSTAASIDAYFLPFAYAARRLVS